MKETIQQEIARFEQKLNEYKLKGLSVIASSSFQTHSIPMLHILSKLDPTIPICFLQTGFHFPETIRYKNTIRDLFQLNVIELESSIPKSMQRDSKNQFYFVSKPSYCCNLNKVAPMNELLKTNDIWITGVRKDQSKTRSNFEIEAPGPHNTTRFHPMLNWTDKMIWQYIHDHNIPHHPLEAKGYTSVGCEPCTAPSFNEKGERIGRWAGMNKTECGLHTDLAK